MDAIRIYTTVEQDGEIHLANLPIKRGQRVEMIVLPEPAPSRLRGCAKASESDLLFHVSSRVLADRNT